MSNILFNPTERVMMECEYFQVRNDIFDLEFTVRATRRFKDNGKFIKDKVLVEYRELDIYEITTYVYLCRCANNKDNAFPSYNDISKKIKCGRTKAIECIKVLNDNGFIYKEKRFNENGEKTSNLYYINTKLTELKDKLSSLYTNREEEIISTVEGGLSDISPSLSDTSQSSLSDTSPSLSDDHKQKQLKKNNIKQKQLNNNKGKNTKKDTVKGTSKKVTIDVVDEEINKLKARLFVLLNIDFSNKEVESIIKALKSKYNSIDEEAIKNVCSLIKNSKTEIVNPVAYILTAIKNDYVETKHNRTTKEPKNLGFNNFEAREYDYDLLEKQLLGWDEK